jgi:ADP-heptose:LPS heptosyltransferase
MKKALLIRFGGLGDLLIALPSIRFLRARFPEARLTLVCRRQYGELFRETRVVDEVIPEDSRFLLPLFNAGLSLESEFGGWLGSFDFIMAWTQGKEEDFLLKTPGIRAGGALPRIIPADPGGSAQMNVVFFQKTAKALGENASLPIGEWSRLPLTEFSKDAGSKIIIHPGSGSEAKRWPLENFLKIIGELGEKGIAGALITGEAEENMVPAIEGMALPPNWRWIRCPPILSLARLLSGTGLYLGNDSGVTHLAAACGAAVVALFRSEFASAWRPLGSVQMLSATSLEKISLGSVRRKIFSGMKNKKFSA